MKIKASTIFFIVLLPIFLSTIISTEPDLMLEKFKQELVEKEGWLISELDDIAKFMNFEESDHRYSNREVLFDARYASPEYDYNKLIDLYSHLVGKGWVDVTSQVDKSEYIIKTASKSKASIEQTLILCNKKATIFMYMTDMQNDYIIDLFKTRTLVHLMYNYNLPCYNLNE